MNEGLGPGAAPHAVDQSSLHVDLYTIMSKKSILPQLKNPQNQFVKSAKYKFFDESPNCN